MPDGPVLKYRPGDFLVRESMVVELCDDGQPGQHYLILRKCGYTTMEAVRLVAGELGLATRQVTYGGLKDEDGITEQLIAIPAATPIRQLNGPGWLLAAEGIRWIKLSHYGYGTEPLRIGGLEGNGFRVVVRNLGRKSAAGLDNVQKINLLALNYYDTQRFGVPGQPKHTHLVGRAILDDDWASALHRLIMLNTPESNMAAQWRGTPRDFFLGLDQRTTAFYLAAYASYQWNAALRTEVAVACPGHYTDIELEALKYRYTTSSGATAKVIGSARELPYDRYSFEEGKPVATVSVRPTVVQAVISIGKIEADDQFGNAVKATLSFFLPSGCYATSAIRQLLGYLSAGNQ